MADEGDRMKQFGDRVSGKLTMVSYFSGGGLAEWGLCDLFDVVGGVERDEKIAAHHHVAYPNVDLRVEDVCTVDPSAWVGVDYAHFSPSCVHASVANQGAGGECVEDRAAADAVCRGIRIMHPSMITVENVGPYRAFDSYRNICECLTEQGYRWDARVYNAADYGVPQTRKRLYLRAWLRKERLPHIEPTHCERGKLESGSRQADLFREEPLLPWVGWYEALTHPRYGRDLIPTLPPSHFAPWQIARLDQEITDSLMVGGANTSEAQAAEGVGVSQRDDPSRCVNASNSLGWRAFLVDGQQTVPAKEGGRLVSVPDGDQPALTVCGSSYKGLPSAYLVGVNGEHGDLMRAGGTPAPAVTANHAAGKYRAVLVEGDAAGARVPTIRESSAPSFTLKAATGGRVHRGIVDGGRVVSLTPEALARFQLGVHAQSYPLPASRKLACQIIGGGCPSELQRAVVLSMLDRGEKL